MDQLKFAGEILLITYAALWGVLLDLTAEAARASKNVSLSALGQVPRIDWKHVNEIFWDNFTAVAIAKAFEFFKSDQVWMASAISAGETFVRKSPPLVGNHNFNVEYNGGGDADWGTTARIGGALLYDSVFVGFKTGVNALTLDQFNGPLLEGTAKQEIWGGWRVLSTNLKP